MPHEGGTTRGHSGERVDECSERVPTRHTWGVRSLSPGPVLMWTFRLAWVAMAALGGRVVDDLTAGRSGWGATGVQIVAMALWTTVAVASVVPSARSLTAIRVLTPAPLIAAVLTLAAGLSSAADAGAAAALALAILAAGSSAEFGRRNIQASAYGAEERFPLRAPAAYLVAAGVAWVLTATGATLTVVWLRSGHAVGTAVAGAVTAALVVVSVPRWHRLARRWLVIVPAGVVVHDPLVLAETVMLRRHEVAGVTLAAVDTEAADLSGPAGGHLLEIRLRSMVTAVLNAGPRTPGGRAIHLAAALVAPSRPGAALAAARRRGHPG